MSGTWGKRSECGKDLQIIIAMKVKGNCMKQK